MSDICKFTTKYSDYEAVDVGFKEVSFRCQEKKEPSSGWCIFHDKDYLQDKDNYENRKKTVLERLKQKVNHSSPLEPMRKVLLFCK
jgi:hypothetical protein